MRNIRTLLFLGGICFFFSCTTTKPLTSSVQSGQINHLQQFDPIAYISLIEKGNQSKISDSLSLISKRMLNEVIEEFKDTIPVTGKIVCNDLALYKKVRNEIENLCITADRQRNITNLKITPVLDSLLESQNSRFGLATIVTGFTRKKGNYGKQIAKGAAIGILTLGMYYESPIKSSSTIYVMILDAQDNDIAFFKKMQSPEYDPLDKSLLKKQLEKIFEGYLWKKK